MDLSTFDPAHDKARFQYNVGTGVFEYVDPTDRIDLGVGYAGKGRYINRTLDEWRRGEGPIPRGCWKIGDPWTHPRLGRLAYPLTPADKATRDKLDRYGRAGFYIHGDNRLGNRSASSGCIILGPDVRQGIDAIVKRGCRLLHVVA